MAKLQTAENGRTLLRDGKPFFWLADTCWSAFTNIHEEEWLEYLDIRAKQGFNVLQINALPQWDRCLSDLDVHPFPTKDGVRYDFSRIDPLYFSRARSMCRAAVDRGFTLALVVMWCNYVPGTWASRMFEDNVIPEACVEPVVRAICEAFNEFEPVYIVSGDTGFEAEETIQRYRLVADCVERYAPGAPTAYHIKGRYDGLPQEFGERASLYLYQSGHNAGAQHMAHTLAEHFAARTPVHPVINSEPCYEQMGYSHKAYGRFRRPETRWALWNSLLAGACAGITYGAHGVWNWQKPEMPKNPIAGEGFLQALRCTDALHFPGTADYAFAKNFLLDRGMPVLEPCQELLAQYGDSIRAARAGQEILLYVPTNAPLCLRGDWNGYTAAALDLESGTRVPLTLHAADGMTRLEMHPFYNDALILLHKAGS